MTVLVLIVSAAIVKQSEEQLLTGGFAVIRRSPDGAPAELKRAKEVALRWLRSEQKNFVQKMVLALDALAIAATKSEVIWGDYHAV